MVLAIQWRGSFFLISYLSGGSDGDDNSDCGGNDDGNGGDDIIRGFWFREIHIISYTKFKFEGICK